MKIVLNSLGKAVGEATLELAAFDRKGDIIGERVWHRIHDEIGLERIARECEVFYSLLDQTKKIPVEWRLFNLIFGDVAFGRKAWDHSTILDQAKYLFWQNGRWQVTYKCFGELYDTDRIICIAKEVKTVPESK